MSISEKTMQKSAELVDNYLEHYGIRGMKWGVRRRDKSAGRATSTTTYKKAPVTLTDQELNRRIKRMELEKKYNDLNSPAKSDGAKYARSLMENQGRNAVGTIVGGVLTFAVQRALKKKFGG